MESEKSVNRVIFIENKLILERKFKLRFKLHKY